VNLAALLQKQADTRRSGVAIIDRCGTKLERYVSYADLAAESSRVAGSLQSLGVTPGDHVLILVGMSAELYTLLNAVFRLGAVAMFLDPSAGRAHLEQCCRMVAPKAFIAGWKGHALKLTCGALRRIPLQIVTGGPGAGFLAHATSWARSAAPLEAIYDAAPDWPALITFTSGSTGRPKGAVRTHGFLYAQHQTLQASLHLVPAEVDLATLPIFALANLASGLTTVIPPVDLRHVGQVDAALVVHALRRGGVMRTTASPAFLERVVDYCLRQRLTLEMLRRVYTGGAPVFPRTLARIQQVCPNALVTAVYGSTEAEPIAQIDYHAMTPRDLTSMVAGRGLLAGTPEPCLHVRILGARWGQPVAPLNAAEFAAACQPTGEPGEIVVSGAHVLKGYLHGIGDEQTKFRVADTLWHRTGDAGYLDEAGRLWLLGRCEACIHDDRGTVYPFAVEAAVLQQNPAVRRAALLALEGQRWLALEVTREAPADLVEQVRRQTASMHLDAIGVFRRVPVDKRHNAKIDYPALRRLLAGRGN
jgi:acyl-CoA synthetase (AMP-forming)/AMP-acid ligase II